MRFFLSNRPFRRFVSSLIDGQMTNESIMKDADGIYDEFATPEKAAESVKLKVMKVDVDFCRVDEHFFF